MKYWLATLLLILASLSVACDDLDPKDDPVARTDPTQDQPAKEKVLPSHLKMRVERQQVEVCRRPYGLASSHDGKTVYVACPGSHQLSAIDTETMEVRWTSRPSCERLFRVLADPQRDMLYAVGMNGRFVVVFDSRDGQELTQISAGRYIADIAFVPGQDRMVVSAAQPPKATLIDLSSLTVDGAVIFPTPPGSLAMRADGRLAAASSGLWKVTVGGTVPLFEPIYLFDPTRSGSTYDHLGFGGIQGRRGIFVRGGSTLLVPGRQSATVSVFDVDSRRLARTIQVGAAPEMIVSTPDQRWALTLDTEGASLTRIDLHRREASGHIVLPANPQDMLVSPDGAEVYVTLAGGTGKKGYVAVVDVKQLTIMDLIPVGADPCCMAFSDGGRRLYVSNFLSNSVSLLE